jgi:nucleoside-diphosphate-sugar epimerase
MSKQTILITGATGFIGRHVVRRLGGVASLRLICIVRGGERHPHAESLLNAGAALIAGDFCDEALVQKIFTEHSIDQVIHMGAIRGGRVATAADYRRVNVEGTELLLREAHKHKIRKFIYCSSVGVYGAIPAKVPADLNTPFRGENQYHQSKIDAEQAVQSYIDKGLNAYIVRPSVTYGSGDDGFAETVTRLVKQRLLFLPRTDHHIHLVDVEKVAEVFLNLVLADECTQRVLIAADNDAIRFRDLVDWIHWYFYQRPYPRYLRLPDWAFQLSLHLFEKVGNEKWAARLALLSGDWHYQCADTYRLLKIKPIPTREAFGAFMQANLSR